MTGLSFAFTSPPNTQFFPFNALSSNFYICFYNCVGSFSSLAWFSIYICLNWSKLSSIYSSYSPSPSRFYWLILFNLKFPNSGSSSISSFSYDSISYSSISSPYKPTSSSLPISPSSSNSYSFYAYYSISFSANYSSPIYYSASSPF